MPFFAFFGSPLGKLAIYALIVLSIFAAGAKAGYSFEHTRRLADQAEISKKSAEVLLQAQQEIQALKLRDQAAAVERSEERSRLAQEKASLTVKLAKALAAQDKKVLDSAECSVSKESVEVLNQLLGAK